MGDLPSQLLGLLHGTATVGVFQAFAQYYRLAAADAVGVEGKGRAISTVLAGGVVAAVCGPLLAAWSKDWLAPVTFAGSYALVTCFGLLSIALPASLYRDAAPVAGQTATHEPARPLGEICGSRFSPPRSPITRSATPS